MNFYKKSLGQNFLIDKNIIKKIINIVNIKNKNIIEIGPGKGALTEEIIKKKPKSLVLLEKDYNLSKELKLKYSKKKIIYILNKDVLKFDFKEISKKKHIILGNLPYNISSQILVKILKNTKWPSGLTDLIFMFQKELGEKIVAKYPSKDYGRLSIISNYRFNIFKKFLVSPNCFIPRPKVTSMVIHFKPKERKEFNIKKIANLEKITNTLFSNRRKMINKNLKKILNAKKINKIPELNQNLRAEHINPNFFYKITEIYEEN